VPSMRRWNKAEYRLLFRDHPPTNAHAPELGACESIAASINRTPGAIAAQWGDARSAVLGNATAASRGLRAYLQESGWL
jgi:hypothetical protein